MFKFLSNIAAAVARKHQIVRVLKRPSSRLCTPTLEVLESRTVLSVVFSFDNGPILGTTPFSVTQGQVTASFSSPADPGGFSGFGSPGPFQHLSGNTVFDPGSHGTPNIPLNILFSQPLTSVSLNFATDDSPIQGPPPGVGLPPPPGTISPSTFNLQAFAAGAPIGSASAVGTVPNGLTFPEGTISFSSTTPFTSLVLSTTGGAPYFAIDNVDVTPQSASQISLSLDEKSIVPVNANGLNINQLIGSEDETIPITVHNLTHSTVVGTVSVTVYLSSSGTIDSSAKAITTQQLPVNLDSLKQTTVNLTAAIPTNLTAGTKYFFVVQATSQNLNVSSTVAATLDTFEFVGTPTFALGITKDHTYYDVLKDTISGVDPFTAPSLIGLPSAPTTGLDFTADLEGVRLSPYLDSRNIPTIGIGLNLTTLTPDIQSSLVSAVKAYYAAQFAAKAAGYMDISQYSATQVIGMLKVQAGAAKSGKVAPVAMTRQDAQALFTTAYSNAQHNAIALVGQALWDSLTGSAPTVQWILTDISYNGGLSGFTGFLAALKAPSGPDYRRAGFELLDSLRSYQQIQYARSLADFEYLMRGVSLSFS